MSTTGSDPVDDIIPDPAAAVAVAADPAAAADATQPQAADTVTLSRSEYQQMMETNRSLQAIAPFADEIRNAIVSGQLGGTVSRGVQPVQATVTEEDRIRANQDFFSDAAGTTTRIAQQVAGKFIEDRVAPKEAQLNARYASLAIENFKASKRDDPYYNAAMGLFDQRVSQLPLDQLGAGDPNTLRQQLDFIWDAATGQYARARTAQVTKQRAAQIPSGGSAGAGGGSKKTLQEIDPVAYNLAIAAGLPQEAIDELAAELGG